MAIAFTCECGKRLKVADNLLGKKVKCPDCQKVTVATAGAAKPAAASSPTGSAPRLGEGRVGVPPPAKSKPTPPAPKRPPTDEEDVPDISSLLKDDSDEVKPVAKKKAAKSVPADEDDEPDLSSFLDDEEEAAPSVRSPAKKSAKPVNGDDEPDLSSLLDNDDEDIAESPPKKNLSKKTPVHKTSADEEESDAPEMFDDDDEPVTVSKSRKPALDADEELPGDLGEDEDEDEDDDEGDETPVRAKKRPDGAKPSNKRLLILVGAAVGVLVLAAVGYFVVLPMLFPSNVPASKQAKLPPKVPAPTPPQQTPVVNPTDPKAPKPGDKEKDKPKGNDTPTEPIKQEPKILDPAPKEEVIENSLGMKLVRIKQGNFEMGSPKGEPERDSYEDVHNVEITQPFYMGKFEVTQAEYKQIMGDNPSKFKGDKLPVENVSWDDAKEFCSRLSAKEGRLYTLPTEAEWEYTCRAGTPSAFHTGNMLDAKQANIGGDKTKDVGSFPANDFGLCDMHGNVAEWCEDRFAQDYYKNSPKADPKGAKYSNLDFRVVRGGSWESKPGDCRSAKRDCEQQTQRDPMIGFRVVLRPRP